MKKVSFVDTKLVDLANQVHRCYCKLLRWASFLDTSYEGGNVSQAEKYETDSANDLQDSSGLGKRSVLFSLGRTKS